MTRPAALAIATHATGALVSGDAPALPGQSIEILAAGLGEVEWGEVARPVRDALGCSVVAIHADDAQSGESLVV